MSKLGLVLVDSLPAKPRQVATAVPLENAVNPYVKKAIDYWRSLCGQRRFPARADMTLRVATPLLRRGSAPPAQLPTDQNLE